MNKFLTSLIGIIVFLSVMGLLGNFFDIDSLYTTPFMMWIVAVFIFNMFLEKNSNNYFMKDIKNF